MKKSLKILKLRAKTKHRLNFDLKLWSWLSSDVVQLSYARHLGMVNIWPKFHKKFFSLLGYGADMKS